MALAGSPAVACLIVAAAIVAHGHTEPVFAHIVAPGPSVREDVLVNLFDRWRGTPALVAPLVIQRTAVAMGDESEPILLDLPPGTGREHLTAAAVLDALVRHYSDGRYGWVCVGRSTTTWVLWLYPVGRFGGNSEPLAVITCDPVAVTHLLVPEKTHIGPEALLLLVYRNVDDPDMVAASPRR